MALPPALVRRGRERGRELKADRAVGPLLPEGVLSASRGVPGAGTARRGAGPDEQSLPANSGAAGANAQNGLKYKLRRRLNRDSWSLWVSHCVLCPVEQVLKRIPPFPKRPQGATRPRALFRNRTRMPVLGGKELTPGPACSPYNGGTYRTSIATGASNTFSYGSASCTVCTLVAVKREKHAIAICR